MKRVNMTLYSMDQFSDMLKLFMKDGFATVTFTKKDGSERVMECTQNLGNVPEESQPKGEGYPAPEGLFRVYEKDVGWRSFNQDQLKSYKGVYKDIKYNVTLSITQSDVDNHTPE